MTGFFLNGKWQTIYGIHTWIRHGNSYWCRTSRPSTGCCMSAVAKSLLRCQPFLVGGLNPSEKYYSIGMIIPNICKKKKFQTTNQILLPSDQVFRRYFMAAFSLARRTSPRWNFPFLFVLEKVREQGPKSISVDLYLLNGFGCESNWIEHPLKWICNLNLMIETLNLVDVTSHVQLINLTLKHGGVQPAKLFFSGTLHPKCGRMMFHKWMVQQVAMLTQLTRKSTAT